jgi:hypothetical protein
MAWPGSTTTERAEQSLIARARRSLKAAAFARSAPAPKDVRVMRREFETWL